MVDRVEPPPQGRRDRLGRVQAIGPAHRLAESQVQVLLVLGNLLHVGAFVLGRLVSEQVPNPDAVAGRCD